MSRLFPLLAALLFAACAPSATPAVSDPDGRLAANVRLTVVAGPVCPVETTPPDPSCAPRPLPAASLAITAPDGTVTIVTSGGDGVAATRLPAGDYAVVPMPVEGILGTAAPFTLQVRDQGLLVARDIVYDTGIR
jgi:hypothetical protein